LKRNILKDLIVILLCIIYMFRCFSALGDIAKARYMKETFRLAEEISRTKVSLQLMEVKRLIHLNLAIAFAVDLSREINLSLCVCTVGWRRVQPLQGARQTGHNGQEVQRGREHFS
jgi:hypothetical protein